MSLYSLASLLKDAVLPYKLSRCMVNLQSLLINEIKLLLRLTHFTSVTKITDIKLRIMQCSKHNSIRVRYDRVLQIGFVFI